MLILDIVLENSRLKLLADKENSQVLQIMLASIANKYQDDSAFLVIQKMLISKSPLLGSMYEQSQFVEEFLKPFAKNKEDEVAAEIMTACYYY